MAEGAPLLTASNLSKAYDGIPVLSDISFVAPQNRVVTFVGENGAGKSTLFNILSGITKPDRGTLSLRGAPFSPRSYRNAWERGVSRVFQEQSLVLNIPVYENLVLGQEHRFTKAGFVDRRAMIRVARRIVEDAGLKIDVRRETGAYDFSSGSRSRSRGPAWGRCTSPASPSRSSCLTSRPRRSTSAMRRRFWRL